ncbi:YciI family protein [Lentibacter algarum]|uniref:YciI family protein n=1 Tax=Lentibacter algarum TaxID=576131 RepID=UPI001C06AFF5|nr:YciI family protein [Lentibacter algarum]MBU2980373.1 YciI family protein [Lentibacter algarum]
MLIALICTDKPGALDVRKSNRDAHLAYIKDTGVVAMAGPLLDAAGDMAGSLVVLDVESLSDAQAWADNDPYAKAGLFSDVRIQAWKKVIG